MQTAPSLVPGIFVFISPSASAPASAPHPDDTAEEPARPRKKPKSPLALFRRASRADSLPDFIEALEVARSDRRRRASACQGRGQGAGPDDDDTYRDAIESGLRNAISAGRIDQAAYLLDNEPLAPAIMREHIMPRDFGQNPSIPLFELLIVQHGWDVNKEDVREKRTLISWAAEQTDEHELVCWLLDHGARVDFGDDNYAVETLWPRPPPLLETCAAFGSVESFRLLQAKGARLGRRALHFSCYTAALCGADPGDVTSSLDQGTLGRGEDLGEEVTEGKAKVGDDVEAEFHSKRLVQRQKREAMLRHLVDEVGLDVNQTDTDIISIDFHWGTPLCYAAGEEHGAAVVRWLIGKGADPLFKRRTIDADMRARGEECHEVREVLEQWKELNPEKVQEKKSSDNGFEMPHPEWRGKTWQEWEAYYREEVARSR